MTIENTIIVIHEEPYVVWEMDLKARNLEFIEGIDEEYFEYVLNTFIGSEGDPTPTTEEERRASIAIRIAYHHALETLFSLLGCYVQAPDCAYAWIAKCSNQDLRSVVQRINNGDTTLFSAWKAPLVTWQSISDRVFRCYMSGTEKSATTAKQFAALWQQLAHEFLDQHRIDEYNSLKHGFRVRSGGFALAVGAEHQYGVPPPSNEMNLIGHSQFGTMFFKLEPISDLKKRNLCSRRTSLNWRIERVIGLLQLAALSIANVKSALRIEAGAKPGTCKFVRPSEDSDFDKPWSFSSGVTNFNLDYVIDPKIVPAISRKELWEKLNELRRN
jgi:hypothetical protein